MKKTDYLFWTVLLLIALFYIFKGNDIHNEKLDLIKQNSEKNEESK